MRKDFNELTLWDDDMDIFSPISNALFGVPSLRRHEKELNRLMKTDIKENDKSYQLEIEMPGIDKKDVNIDLKDGYLTISAEKQENKEQNDEKGNYLRKERYYGSASRSFYVGDKIKSEDIGASLKDGILAITVPKKTPEIEQHKKIEID